METKRPIFLSSLPLIYLHLAGSLLLLPTMYDRLITVPEVIEELRAEKERGGFGPGPNDLPPMEVHPSPSPRVEPDGRITPMNAALFSLARTFPNSLTIVEDRNVRREADRLGLKCTGVIGMLLMAKQVGKISSVSALLPLLAEGGLKLSSKARFAVLVMAKEI